MVILWLGVRNVSLLQPALIIWLGLVSCYKYHHRRISYYFIPPLEVLCSLAVCAGQVGRWSY